MPEETYSFDNYANFKTGDEVKEPALPIENAPDLKNIDLHHGAFTSVFDIGNGKVAKLSRFMDIRKGEVRMRGKDFLVEKSGDSPQDKENDREAVIQKLVNYANIKRQTLETLGQYVGDYLPRVEMFAIVDSPRQVLESRFKYKGNTPEDIKKVPVSEASLMEIWERVNAEKALENQDFEQLKKTLYDPEKAAELAKFGNAALKLLEEKRILLDLCDRSGVRGIDAFGIRIELKDLEHLQRADKLSPDQGVIFPRNLTIEGNKLKYYDVYPINEVDEDINNEVIQDIKSKIRESDWHGIREFLNDDPKNKRALVVQYIFLLKKMGAEL